MHTVSINCRASIFLLLMFVFIPNGHCRWMSSPLPYYGQGTSLSASERIPLASGPSNAAGTCQGVRSFYLDSSSMIDGTCSCFAPGMHAVASLVAFAFSWTPDLNCTSQFDTPAGVPFTYTVRDYLWCPTDTNIPGNDSSVVNEVFLSPGFAPVGVIDLSFTQDPPFGDGPAPWFYYRVQIPAFNQSVLNASNLFIDVHSYYTTNLYMVYQPRYPEPLAGTTLLPSPHFYTWSSHTGFPVVSSRLTINATDAGSYLIAINCPKRASCGVWRLKAAWNVPDMLGVNVIENGSPWIFNLSLKNETDQLARYTAPYCNFGCFFRMVLRCPSDFPMMVVYLSRDVLSPSAEEHMHALRCGQAIPKSESIIGWQDTANITGAWYLNAQIRNFNSTTPASDSGPSENGLSPSDSAQNQNLPSLFISFSPYMYDLTDHPTVLFVNGSTHYDAMFPFYQNFAQFSFRALKASNVTSSDEAVISSFLRVELRLIDNIDNESSKLLSCAGELHIFGPSRSPCDTFACVGSGIYAYTPDIITDENGIAAVQVDVDLNLKQSSWFQISWLIRDRDAISHGNCNLTKPLLSSLRIDQYPGSTASYLSSSSSSSSSGMSDSSTGSNRSSNPVTPRSQSTSPHLLWLLLLLLLVPLGIVILWIRSVLHRRSTTHLHGTFQLISLQRSSGETVS